MTPREVWARTFGRRSRSDAEVDEEIRAHLAMAVEANRRQGMSESEARRAAAVQFGTVDAAKEQVRDQVSLPGLDWVLRDIKYSLRGLRRSPGFTVVTAVTLALGVGLCGVFFTVMYGVMFRPLVGVPSPDRLFATEQPVSYPYFEAFADEDAVDAVVAAWVGPTTFNVAPQGPDDTTTARVKGHIVSPEYFEVFGVEPRLGRFFETASDGDLDARSVVVTDDFWRARLGSSPEAVGGSIRVNGRRMTIIGVGPPEFRGVYPSRPAEIFVPVAAGAEVAPELDGGLQDSTLKRFNVLLRLAPGETGAAAGAALTAVAGRLDEQLGERAPLPAQQRRITLMAAGGPIAVSALQRRAVGALYAVLIGLILALTCASLAGLVLARGGARGKEVAIRLSLGASRIHLVRQLLTESAVLAMVGGAAGLGFSYALLRAIAVFIGGPEDGGSASPTLTPDLTVVLVTFAVAAMASVGFGLLPALGATRPDVVRALKGDASGGVRRYRRFGMRNLFVVGQVAVSMSLVLVVGSLIIGGNRGAESDPGFDTSGLQVFSVDPRRDGLTAAESERVLTELSARLKVAPGVEGVSFGTRGPLEISGRGARAIVTEAGAEENSASLQQHVVGLDFLSTLGVTALRGVDLDAAGASSAEAVQPAVLNQAAATALFGDADALGRRLTMAGDELEVVGVVRYGVALPFVGKPAPAVFTRMAGSSLSDGATMVVRSAVGVDAAAIDQSVEQVDPRLTVFELARIDNHLSGFERSRDSMAALNSCIGVFALILACVGLAGVTSQAVERRRKEIGIEIALGALSAQVLRSVMREGVVMVLVGVVLGWAAAFGVSRVIMAIDASLAQLIPAGLADLWLTAGTPVLLIALALLACYLPARRAVDLDPLTALRTD